MIRLTYYFFYALSLLPLWVLYGIADFFYLVLFYLVGYRKKVVWTNLKNAFPRKTDKELRHIRRRFYRCFMQNWMETVKLLSISKRVLDDRTTYDWEAINSLYEEYPRIQILLGHCFNWEWSNASASIHLPYLPIPVYLQVSNKAMDQLFVTIRSRFGAKPVQAGEMARQLLPYRNSRFVLALLADQSPPKQQQAYWVNFMNQPTAFIKGPERNARASGMPVVFVSVKRTKRGHYHFGSELFCLNPAATAEGELTRRYARRLQEEIEESPHTYMWTHKRWKIRWEKKFQNLWVDDNPIPKES
jgi:Kdo2-lipid IVA lauroyltransferase/acyltransferase